jgi:hypothetical protein
MNGAPLGFAELLTAVSLLGYSLFAWIFAVRLLRMVRGTWSLPEVSLATGYLFVAGIGYPMVAAGIGAWESLGETTSLSIQIVGGLVLRVGLAGIFVFTWQTFRAEASWAKALTIVGVLLLTANAVHGIAGLSAAPSFEAAVSFAGTGPPTIASIALAALAFGWPAAESLGYYLKLRRRQALGLADPVVVNRFWLWGIACASSVFVSCVNIAAAVAGRNLMEYQPAMITSATLGIVNSILLILAFLPPAPYLRFVRRRAGVSDT